MPDIKYINELERIQKKLFTDTKRLLVRIDTLNESDKIQLIRQTNFLEMMNKDGLGKAVAGYEVAYENLILQHAREFMTKGYELNPAVINDLTSLKDVSFEGIVQAHQQYASGLKSTIIEGIMAGTPTALLIESFQDVTTGGLTSAQASVAIREGFARFDRAVIARLYQPFPDVRFIYHGPLDGKTRESCRDTLGNPGNEKGFTRAEILGLPVNMITGGGFNCRHLWLVV